MINFNATTPAAPAHAKNGNWQQDGAGNTSVNITTTPLTNTFTPSAGVLTIDAGLGDSARVNINAAITSMSITNAVDGQELTILWVQDATGHAVTLATNMAGATAPSTSANSVSQQRFQYYAANSKWYATSAGVTGM